jgi:hypothetical protein
MTISGVRKRLSGKLEEADYKYEINESLSKIKSLLIDLKDNLS